MSPRVKFIIVVIGLPLGTAGDSVGAPMWLWAPLSVITGWYIADVWRALRR
jgi:hypothetical protein